MIQYMPLFLVDLSLNLSPPPRFRSQWSLTLDVTKCVVPGLRSTEHTAPKSTANFHTSAMAGSVPNGIKPLKLM